MPGAIPLHGYAYSQSTAGMGGSERVAAQATGMNVSFPSNLSFFVWLAILGIIVPSIILGGLTVGRFHFVFRGR